jgi:hypothetical protein
MALKGAYIINLLLVLEYKSHILIAYTPKIWKLRQDEGKMTKSRFYIIT